METIETGLYWQLPSPRKFIQHITDGVSQSRGVVLNLPEIVTPGTRDSISQGLCHASVHSTYTITVRSGTDISLDVGVIYEVERLTAGQLAAHKGKFDSAIILQATDDRSQILCEAYMKEFIDATQHHQGNVHLVVSIHDGRLLEVGSIGTILVNPFDGGLMQDEMDAYVNLRMIRRSGPGSTRLLRAIVSEFSGFDALFSEKLMALDDGAILHIREHLKQMMDEDVDRWRENDWIKGTYSLASDANHVLREQYLLSYGDVHAVRKAKDLIDARFWRACLKEITPWLEKNRYKVIEPLLPQLRKLTCPEDNYKMKIPKGNTGYLLVDVEEVEYNTISYLANAGQIRATSKKQDLAIIACKKVKAVRDDIAHLRAPDAMLVKSMIDAIDKTRIG